MATKIVFLLLWNSNANDQYHVVDAFAPTPPTFHPLKQQQQQQQYQQLHQPFKTYKSESKSKSTQLNYGVLVPVPDDFFTVAGISLGFAYTITRSWNRVVVENVAWEKRLEDARMRKLDDDDDDDTMGGGGGGGNTYTELDLRKIDAEASQSSYGPDAMERRRSRRRRRVRVLDMDEDDDDDDYDDDYEYENKRSEERSYSMSDTQINDFEETYGVAYDPYYDEPYTVDELPDDVSFVEDKVYGDRRYQNGEIFYRDENDKNLYWRQGGRPRLKQFWELF